MEAIIYIFMSSVLTYGALTIAKLCMVRQSSVPEAGKPKPKLSFLKKLVVTKQETLEWDGFPRQIGMYTIQAVLYALL